MSRRRPPVIYRAPGTNPLRDEIPIKKAQTGCATWALVLFIMCGVCSFVSGALVVSASQTTQTTEENLPTVAFISSETETLTLTPSLTPTGTLDPTKTPTPTETATIEDIIDETALFIALTQTQSMWLTQHAPSPTPQIKIEVRDRIVEVPREVPVYITVPPQRVEVTRAPVIITIPPQIRIVTATPIPTATLPLPTLNCIWASVTPITATPEKQLPITPTPGDVCIGIVLEQTPIPTATYTLTPTLTATLESTEETPEATP